MNEKDNNDKQAAAIVSLEEALSFQQRQLEELNQVLIEQRGELDRQQQELARLATVVEELASRGGEDLPHERPPHY